MAGSIRAVVDASFILAFLLPDEDIPEVIDTISRSNKKEIELISSTILPYEIFNCLKTAILRKRISLKLAKKLGKDFFELGISIENIDYSEALQKASEYNLSFYDASYVWLAKSRNISLLSLDKKMMKLVAK